MGEVGLTVRYKNTLLRLSEVTVSENKQIPLILGIEWIKVDNVSFAVENHQGIVTLLGPITMENAEDGAMEARKAIFPVVSNEGLKKTTNNENETKVNLHKVKNLKDFGEGKTTLPKIMEDPNKNLELKEFVQQDEPESDLFSQQNEPVLDVLAQVDGICQLVESDGDKMDVTDFQEPNAVLKWKERDMRRREYHVQSNSNGDKKRA